MSDADPLRLACRAVHRALDTLRDSAFTGVLIITWPPTGPAGVTWEGVGTVTTEGVRWHTAHTTALQAVRGFGVLAGARVVVQLRAGVPVGTHLDTLE